MERPYRILLLEDNSTDAELIKFEIEEAEIPFTLKVVSAKKEFIRELQSFTPDVILSDYDLPNYSGASALLESTKRCPDTPFILVTGAITEDRAIEILTQGAKDYVLKTRLQQRLVPAIRRVLAEAEEHKARKEAEKELLKSKRNLETLVKERTAQLQRELDERKKIEKALHESQEKYRLVVENALEIILIIQDFKVVFVNKVATLLTGYDERVVNNTPFINFIHPEDRQLVYENHIKRLNGEAAPNYYFFRLFHQDGSLKWFEINSVLIEWKKKPAILSFLRDITKRKEAEEKANKLIASISEEKDRLSALIDSIQDEIWFTDTQKRFTLANHSALKEFHLAAGQTLDIEQFTQSLEVLRPDGSVRPIEEAPPLTALAGKIVRDQEEIVKVPASGEMRYRRVSSSPVRDARGGIIGAVSVVHDVTDLKRYEDAMKKSEALYRAIGESIEYGVWVCEPDGRNIYASESFLKMVGLTQEQCSDFGWGDVLHPDDAETTIAAWKKCVQTGGTWDIVHRFRGRDGQWHHVLARGIPIRDDKGQVTCWAGINLDISEQKTMEQQLRERTMQLEYVNKELESFTYSVSHDLRAPLRAIDGYSRIILRRKGEDFDAETRQQFDVIRDNTRAMNQLIDDLLALSRVGTRKLNAKLFDANQLIEEIWNDLQTEKMGRNVTLKKNALPPAWGDRGLIKQVFANLISNALKFTGKKKETVIEVGGEENCSDVLFYVKDNGVGFDMEYYDKLFGVFQRLHRSDEYEGTGIGLAIVKRIVHHHGGQVWAESEADKGATFYLSLPRETINKSV